MDKYIDHDPSELLTDLELSREPSTSLPWEEIFSRVIAGQPIESITDLYGNERLVRGWVFQRDIKHDPNVTAFLEEKIRMMIEERALEQHSPDVAMAVNDIVAATVPHLAKSAMLLNKAILKRALEIVPDGTASDLEKLAKTNMTITDMTGISQRHASAPTITAQQITVEGFDFVTPTATDLPTQDAELIHDTATLHDMLD